MTSKISLLNGGIVRYNVKRFWWVSAIYAFFLFLAVPYGLIYDRNFLLDYTDRFPDRVLNYITESPIAFILLVGAAVLLGICVFRYLQGTRSTTLFHALPVKRTELYLSSLVSGFVLLAAPILLNGVILFLISFFGGFFALLPASVIFDWMFSQLLTGTAILSFTLFVGVFTGSSIAQVVFVFALCFVPVGVAGLVSTLLDGWLFSYTSEGITATMEFLLQITPIYYPQFLSDEPIWWIPVLAGIYILLFTGLGLFFYHKRHTERAGDVVAFSWVHPIFLYGVTFCVMLLGTSFFSEVTGRNGEGAPNILLLVLFALVGYAAAKILLLKSFRIFKYYKGYAVFMLLTLLVYAGVSFNIFGFGTQVPELQDISKAYIGNYYTHNWEKLDEDRRMTGNSGTAILYDPAEIAMLQSLQQGAIDEGRVTEPTDKERIYVGYELKNGKTMLRKYYVEAEPFFEIMSTKGAKDSMYPNFRLKADKIKYLEIYQKGDSIGVYGAEKDELISCIQNDIERLPFEALSERYMDYVVNSAPDDITSSGITVDVEVQQKVRSIYSMRVVVEGEENKNLDIWFQFNDNFTETLGWLESHGYNISIE